MRSDGNGVLLVGHLGVDLGLGPLASLPAFGQEVLVDLRTSRPGGPVTNSGAVFAALGLPWGAVSVLGADDEGRRVLAALEALGADLRGVRLLAERPTSLSLALLREDGERAFVTHLGAFATLTTAQVAESLERGRYRWLFLNGTCLLPGALLAELPALARRFRAGGGRVAVDTGWDPAGWPPERVELHRTLLAESDLFFPNLLEAAALAGLRPSPEAAAAGPRPLGVQDLREGVEALLSALAALCPGEVVLKLGSAGSALRPAGGEETLYAPATAEPLADSTGAGDAFDAAYLYALTRGLPAPRRLEFANRLVPVALRWREALRPHHLEELRRAFGL
ncbi:MAG: carbohydrate kinase family protein [Firmicutes bacterium]|nr:carbohydrate kinase family protein [Bacillota bacterium]